MTPLQLGRQEYVNTQKNLLAIVASQPFYKTLVYIVYVWMLLYSVANHIPFTPYWYSVSLAVSRRWPNFYISWYSKTTRFIYLYVVFYFWSSIQFIYSVNSQTWTFFFISIYDSTNTINIFNLFSKMRFAQWIEWSQRRGHYM